MTMQEVYAALDSTQSPIQIATFCYADLPDELKEQAIHSFPHLAREMVSGFLSDILTAEQRNLIATLSLDMDVMESIILKVIQVTPISIQRKVYLSVDSETSIYSPGNLLLGLPTSDFCENFFNYLEKHPEVRSKTLVNKSKPHKTIYPSELIYPLSLEANMIFSGAIAPLNNDNKELTPVKAGSRKDSDGTQNVPVFNKMGISFEKVKQNGISFTGHLTKYDEAVHNALLSLWDKGCDYAGVTTIYRVYAHNPKARPTEEAAQEIIDSINRMRNTDIHYDTTDSADHLGFERIRSTANLIYAETKEVHYDSDGIPSGDDVITLNGQPVGFYVHFYGFPLYEWANHKNQVMRYPMGKLACGINRNTISATLETALLRRIAPIIKSSGKKGKCPSNVIVYESLFKESGLLKKPDGSDYTPTSLKSRKYKLKTYTKKFLDSWVKNGLIDRYEEVKENGSATKVIIHPISDENPC